MRMCAFLTMDDLRGFVTYDHLLYEPLARRGWAVELVPWRQGGVDWDRYEAVVIRTPWDYQRDPGHFLEVLEAIERSSARLENRLRLVRWNIDKAYLRDLAGRGVRIVPTRWGQGLDAGRLAALFDDLDAPEIVVKPTVGANADDTFRLSRVGDDAAWAAATAAFDGRAYLAQPFMRSVVEEGEFSLFFFGGAYSHAILKTPKARDFRVQEEHGGRIRAVMPEPVLRAVAHDVLAALDPAPLYARLDFVRTPDGGFAVMEAELIEPSLYFSYDPASPERFAHAFDTWMGG